VGARTIAIGLLVAAAALPGTAHAAGWSKPRVIARQSGDDLVLPYYLQSPNRRRTDLIASIAFGRDYVYPMTRSGRLLRPWRLPDRNGFDPSFDLNDAGATAMVWQVEAPVQPPDDLRGPCSCLVRAGSRGPGGRFTRARTISGAGQVTGYGAAIGPGGGTTAFASIFDGGTSREPLWVAEGRPRRRIGKGRVRVPSVLDWAIDTRRGRPLLLYEERGSDGHQLSLAAPWTKPLSIGNLPGSGWFEFGDYAGRTLAADGRGNELLVVDEFAVSSRRGDAAFGPFRRIGRPARGSDACSVDATMNRRLALVAWNCSSEEDGHVQVAVLSPTGRLRWRSKVFLAWRGGDTPDLALDPAGRWAVAWQESSRNDRYRVLTGRGKRHFAVRKLAGPSTQPQPPDVEFLPGGVAHATWVNETRRASNVMESLLRVP
jgi:hypothetical protein